MSAISDVLRSCQTRAESQKFRQDNPELFDQPSASTSVGSAPSSTARGKNHTSRPEVPAVDDWEESTDDFTDCDLDSVSDSDVDSD